MSSFIRICAFAMALVLALPLRAEMLSGLARLDLSQSAIVDAKGGPDLTLALSQPVPWRAFTLADPPRLVLDFREVDWRGVPAWDLLQTTHATGLRMGAFRPGWSRLVVDLAGPYAISSASMQTGSLTGAAVVRVSLNPTDEASFQAQAGAPDGAEWGALEQSSPPPPPNGDRFTIVLDPGHGGIDPGAQSGDITEAALMLTFARELKDVLLRRTDFDVVLTRNADIFVPLDGRITLARAAGADVFLSLHADAVSAGRATGATIYTLSETASDEAAAALAERHDRADLLAGVDLSDQDDVVAGVLMDIARLDTDPRSSALADALAQGIGNTVGGLHKRPRQSAGFSVLRAPDVPSALIELGFLSSDVDRDRLTSPEWRAKVAEGIVSALQIWAAEDTARAGLLRR